MICFGQYGTFPLVESLTLVWLVLIEQGNDSPAWRIDEACGASKDDFDEALWLGENEGSADAGTEDRREEEVSKGEDCGRFWCGILGTE